MRYVTLKKQYAFRGWGNLPYGILDIDSRVIQNVQRLTPMQFRALELFTAGISIDDTAFSAAMRDTAVQALQEGVLEECSQGTQLEPYQKYRRTTARYLHTLLWSITGNCNLACKHCYISSGSSPSRELTVNQYTEIIEQLEQANVPLVALTGGEPLLCSNFFDIVDALQAKKISVLQIFTNALLLDEPFLDQIESRNLNLNYFVLSFDGVGCHDWMRGVAGAEQAVIDAIRLLKRRGYRVMVVTVVHNGNLHSLEKTYEMMKQLEVDVWKAAPVMDTGNWRNQQEQALDRKNLYQAYLALIERYAADGEPLTIGLSGFFWCSKGSLADWESPYAGNCGTDQMTECYVCNSAHSFPYLLPDGKLLPCISMSGTEAERNAPNVFETGLAELLSSSAHTKLIDTTYGDLFVQNSECALCEHRFRCKGCRAMAMCCEQDFLGKDLYACDFMKGGYEAKMKDLLSLY